MSWLAQTSTRDRQLVLFAAASGLILIVLIAVFGPNQDEDSRVPSTYSKGSHGAQAAFLMLQKSGYHVEQSVNTLESVAGSVNAQTTVILADPFESQDAEGEHAVKQILAHGGRVLATGDSGAMMLPHGHPRFLANFDAKPCTAGPTGLSSLAAADIRILPDSRWTESDPAQEVVYRCNKDAVVVTYPAGKGAVVWWASSSPLQNAEISQAGNLSLLLNSIGPRETTRVIWDESLHGASPSLWSYTAGTVLPYVWWQCLLAGALLVFSFSRRSGPLRPDPVVSRAAPLEFVRALGSLYRKAGANSLPVALAYRQFRIALERALGVRRDAPGETAIAALRHCADRLPNLKQQLEAAEKAPHEDSLTEKQALALVQALQAAEQQLP